MSTAPLATYSRMIKLSHTIFSLPFALAAAALAAQQVPVSFTQLALIVGCVTAARSSAMGFNRIVDRDIDAANPRTANREIPAGQISLTAAWAFTLISAALFVLFCALLGTSTLYLSPIALAIVWGYSLSKRITWLCHLVLGLALALAPTGVWIALTDSYSTTPLLLSLAVGTWVAGFDIIYSCQDAEFDQSKGLNSIPANLGVANALHLSSALHLLTSSFLAILYFQTQLSVVYWAGWLIISLVLAYEHWLVGPNDLSKVDKAFFDLNGYVSVLFLFFVLLASYL